jgi:hypothetical protein
MALAVAELATWVCPLFAIAVALGSPRTPPGPANPVSPTARAVGPCVVGVQPSDLGFAAVFGQRV